MNQAEIVKLIVSLVLMYGVDVVKTLRDVIDAFHAQEGLTTEQRDQLVVILEKDPAKIGLEG